MATPANSPCAPAMGVNETADMPVNSAIIFIFDPSGTAINGINAFKAGAEKFGYILVCSNNSKNGPYQMNFDLTNRLFNHIFSEFNIAENRIYTAGFSGGSRLACTVAVLTGAVPFTRIPIDLAVPAIINIADST